MRKSAIMMAVLLASGVLTGVRAQQSYTYSVSRTRTYTIPINWHPEEKTVQRYTVSVSPLQLVNNGLKFNFETELGKPGHWFGTSIAGYVAPSRHNRYNNWWGRTDGNYRSSFNSGWDDYNRMWGVATSAFFKNTFHQRGWYFSVGVTLEFSRVGVLVDNFHPFVDEGLTFYERGRAMETRSYLKPTAQFNFGKHMALTERFYLDIYAGLGLSYSIFKNDGRHDMYPAYSGGWTYALFTEPGGFARRGLTTTGGFRFGVLLWDSPGQ